MQKHGIGLDTTLAELAEGRADFGRLFTQLGLDYCCQGNRALGEACAQKGLDPRTTLQMLQALDALPPLAAAAEVQADPQQLSLSGLCDHIEQKYHAWLRSEMPRMDGLLEMLEEKHGDQRPWLRPLRELFEQVVRDLDRHMRHEEQTVFPAIRELELKGSAGPHGAVLGFELEQLETEHARCGQDLAQLRALALDFQEPEGACSRTRALFVDLREFEAQMHQHVHLENYVLFSRVREKLAAPQPVAADPS